jgi:hypothetical protein
MAMVPVGMGAIVGPGAIWRLGQDGPPLRQRSIWNQERDDFTDNGVMFSWVSGQERRV